MRIRSIGVVSMIAALALLGGADAVQAKSGKKHASCCKAGKHVCHGKRCCKAVSNNAGHVLLNKGNFKTELDMVKKAGMCHVLCGKGPITMFAPTDEAYAKLGKAKLEDLKKDPKKLVQYHMLNKKVMAGDIKPAGSLVTLQGESLMSNTNNGKAEVDGCLIIEQDVPCGNGVIQVLDEVPVPERGR